MGDETRSAVLGCCTIAVTMIAGCAAPTTRPVAVSAAATDAEALRQTELVVRDLVEKQKRVSRVYRLLATRAHAMCGEQVGPDTGIFALVRPQGDYGAALASNYGIREQLTILFVLEGSPADVAGLKAGDVIGKVNGAPASQAKSIEELHEKLPPEVPIAYEVERSGTPLTLSVRPERACAYRVRVVQSQAVNALADGKRIIVTRGMANFAADDGELALVLAHETAHNSMRHLEAKKQNAGAGLLADLAIILLTRGQVSNPNLARAGAMAYSQEFEAEADYVGLYIMANAGLPIDDAPLFWRRMAAAHPGSIRSNHAASHPSTAQRMVALEGTVREIDAKRVANAPLRPNLKDGQVALSTAAAASAAAAPLAASTAPAVTAGALAVPAPPTRSSTNGCRSARQRREVQCCRAPSTSARRALSSSRRAPDRRSWNSHPTSSPPMAGRMSRWSQARRVIPQAAEIQDGSSA